MKLYIAEKPSLGRAIADALPGPHQKGDGFIRAGNGDCVSWCIGHLLEQAEPESYDPAYKRWRTEDLPIVPEQWQLKPKPKTRKQLSVLRKLVKEADQLVHAGDPDREGQLLVDQVIDHLGVKGQKKSTIQRCLISDLNRPAVKRAINDLKDNQQFMPLSVSALARSRADWLYGINMTRAYTLQGQKVGYSGLLSVGRVQTPILGLVVRRDKEIESFVTKPFYDVVAHLQTNKDEFFSAKWLPSEACEPYQDEDGRVLNRALAENVVKRITDQPAHVIQQQKKNKSQPPPLPYNLSALQIDAAKRFGMSAKDSLDVCQRLYEKHKLITYPRSDSRYLPSEHFQQAASVVLAIESNLTSLREATLNADIRIKSKAWNDAKVSAHHAIIPTQKKMDIGRLSKQELQVYQLIARQYLFQFYPKHEYQETLVKIDINGGVFVTKANQVTLQGWKVLLAKEGDKTTTDATNSNEDQANASLITLPTLRKGQRLHCLKGELLEKHTQPPKYFTDATLLAAMTGISRYVTDQAIRKVLKDTDGLGTEATRAGILELLFNRGYLSRQGKQVRATAAGRGLIECLPDSATTPDMTAQWESTLEAISLRKVNYDSFMVPLTNRLGELISQSLADLPQGLRGIKASKPTYRKRRKVPGKAPGKVAAKKKRKVDKG
ncbi:MAG: DNA topoisomerase III [Moraxellaceae bacterium]|nr:MAG: DNA topoisomerase III [Moraxellaceae bacterium]